MLGSLWRGRRRLFRVGVAVDQLHLYVIPMDLLRRRLAIPLNLQMDHIPSFSRVFPRLCRCRLLCAFLSDYQHHIAKRYITTVQCLPSAQFSAPYAYFSFYMTTDPRLQREPIDRFSPAQLPALMIILRA